ncbi:hypothetical protein L2E82_21000 [Cichorium intybus]|uniref:Uncharacterized protein n=1 Tax=Cichorium intybus TaxID=13427 RepID=A0ACB9DV81_CICIN|nr:hypothetical protein L2E82_21000 [Cichorium intybus]
MILTLIHYMLACSSVESSRLYFIRSTSFLRLRHYRETQTLLTHWRDIPVHSLLLHRHRLLPLNRPEDVWLRMSTLYLDVMSYVVGLRTSILFLDVFCYSARPMLYSQLSQIPINTRLHLLRRQCLIAFIHQPRVSVFLVSEHDKLLTPIASSGIHTAYTYSDLFNIEGLGVFNFGIRLLMCGSYREALKREQELGEAKRQKK